MKLLEFNSWLNKNKKFILFLFILNLIGVVAAFVTYWNIYIDYINFGKWYLLPFVPVSFILYLSMALFLFLVYKGYKIPDFLLIFTFFVNFVYGFGSFVFYPLFMFFVIGFSYYHLWNIFAHLFLGLQSLFVLHYMGKINFWKYSFLAGLVIIKDYLDLFHGTFDYFITYDFGGLKYFLIMFIFLMQFTGIYLLFNFQKFYE